MNLPLQCTATTSNRYGELGSEGGILDEILRSLPSGVYSLTISHGPASAADLNKSVNTHKYNIITYSLLIEKES